jgi:2-methylisocitrate lyase-like PEP mutase family enzyme
MAGKIKAALDARSDPATVIMVRTDAIAVDGLDAAIDRDRRYVDAEAELLFVGA